ncbi:MAG: hypothetical protein ABI417_11090 [Coleofasciculaceae cyanobacterium]
MDYEDIKTGVQPWNEEMSRWTGEDEEAQKWDYINPQKEFSNDGSVDRMLEKAQKKTITTADIEWYKQARRPIAEIIADLSKPIPRQYLSKLKDKGNATYIPWHNCTILLNRCTGGHWDYAITNMQFTSDRIFLVARLSIVAFEGIFTREATGTELLKREAWNKELEIIEIKELAYGDPSSKAESMALRRAAAKFGLALYLYND